MTTRKPRIRTRDWVASRDLTVPAIPQKSCKAGCRAECVDGSTPWQVVSLHEEFPGRSELCFMPHQSLACPLCRHIDQVQKISALVQAERATFHGAGRATGRFAAGGWSGARLGALGGSFSATTDVSGEQSTALSQALAPPTEPLTVDRWGVIPILLLILALVAGWLALATVPDLRCGYDLPNAPTRTVCWEGQGSMFLEMRVGQMPNPELLTQVVDGALVMLPTGLLAGLVVLRVASGRRRRRKFQRAHHAWQREYDRWQRLYYCHRCDAVFEPGATPSVAPAERGSAHRSLVEV